MKTPHRLIHDAKEAGFITDDEWLYFIRSRLAAQNESQAFDYYNKIFMTSYNAYVALDAAFSWADTEQGYSYWLEVFEKLKKYEKFSQEFEMIKIIGVDNVKKFFSPNKNMDVIRPRFQVGKR